MELLDLEDLLEVAQELEPESHPFQIRDLAFPKQLEFIENPGKLKALFCTRRAAKSYTAGLYLVHEALKTPGMNCLYVGLTRMSAKGIVWNDILKDINTKHNCGMVFNGSELTATCPNGSIIQVTGADSQEDSAQKLLGKKYRLICIDEAQSFSVDLRTIIYGILGPATVDQGGTICLLGTSGNLTSGLFFDVTNGREQGWKLFSWTAYDNPHIAEKWKAELEDIRVNRPLFQNTPLFKQWYLNKWVIDSEKLVYRFEYTRNEFKDLPPLHKKDWSYVLGVDLGYDPDPSAFVVVAFHPHDPCLYILECFKKTEMDLTDVAEKIRDYQARYDLNVIVIDGSAKQAVMEIQRRHDIPLVTADKTGKEDFINILNAEFIQGRIKIGPQCQSLKDELLNLIWDDKSIKKREHPNCENHCADSMLYSWRYCYQYLSRAPEAPSQATPEEKYIARMHQDLKDTLQREIYEHEEKKRQDEWEQTSTLVDESDRIQYYLDKRGG